jgi:HlyD family secretion protein
MSAKTLGKTALFLLPVIALTGWWGARQYSGEEAALPPLNTEAVEIGNISRRVVAHGALQPVHRVEVGSQVSGIVDQVFADFNSPVQEGQVIARIEPTTFAAAVSSAEAELDAAEAGLELARYQWARVRELSEREIVSLSEVEQAAANLRQAEAQVRVRQHALERARRELEWCTIRSPTDGIVIARLVDVGQTVAASLSAPLLFEIASDLKQMQIHANVAEADIGMVAEGQRVEFVVDAYRGRQFEGEIVQVRNAPLIEDNVVHYETIIAVTNEERLLKPGMTAEVSIIAAETHGVLRVRNSALRARLPEAILPSEPEAASDGGARVYLLRNGGLVTQRVNTGLSDGVYTEIVDGVSEGDVLAVSVALRPNGEGGSRSLFSGSQAQY